MIKFYSLFQVFDSENVNIPKGIRFGNNFWCSFNTKRHLIMCNIIYLGTDKIMQNAKWYEGRIELPYGEIFPPYCLKIRHGYKEPILLHKNYDLQCGSEKIGECNFLKIKKIIYDDFSITHHKDGSI